MRVTHLGSARSNRAQTARDSQTYALPVGISASVHEPGAES